MNPEIELVIKARNEARRALNQLEKQVQDLERQLGRTDRAARSASKSFGNLAPLLIEVNRASSLAARGFVGLGRNIIGAAANFETYENTVRVFSDTQEQANERIADLIEFSKELVGLDTGNIIQFFGRLTQVGLTDDQAIRAIKGVTEAIAEQGKSSATARLALEQYTQALGNVRPLATDF